MFEEFYKYLLSSPDFHIKRKDENSISFEYKTLNYLFVCDQDDPFYVRLMLPNIANADDVDNKDKIINVYNSIYKVIKVTIVNETLWLSVEQFVYSKDNVASLFFRIISILEEVILDFRTKHLKKH